MTDNQIEKHLDFGEQSKSGISGLSNRGLRGNICSVKSTFTLDAWNPVSILAATIRVTSKERDSEIKGK